MASWTELRSYIYANYKIAYDKRDTIGLRFALAGNRTQLAVVSTATQNASGEEWVHMSSAVAERGQVRNVWPLLDESSEYVLGGLCTAGNFLVVRHAVQLADISVADFDNAIEVIVTMADNLESKVSLVDTF